MDIKNQSEFNTLHKWDSMAAIISQLTRYNYFYLLLFFLTMEFFILYYTDTRLYIVTYLYAFGNCRYEMSVDNILKTNIQLSRYSHIAYVYNVLAFVLQNSGVYVLTVNIVFKIRAITELDWFCILCVKLVNCICTYPHI